MKLIEFQAEIERLKKEICGEDGKVHSHNLDAHILFFDAEGDELEVESIKPAIMFGCGCWDGIYIDLVPWTPAQGDNHD